MAQVAQTRSVFDSDLHFCPECGSILPLDQVGVDNVSCSRCLYQRKNKGTEEVVEEHIIYFNERKKKKDKHKENLREAQEDIAEFDGPTVERHCPRCNHDTMTYTTRQTRSADEGQTVFYSCVKCRFQDIEYS